MKTYIGTKLIQAQPMTRGDYNDYRNWVLPANEDGTDAGYLVEYLDGGKPNDDRHAGYISWSPKAQFDAAYRDCSGIACGLAIEALKHGARVARAGWNGKGMWLTLVSGWNGSLTGTLQTSTLVMPPEWVGYANFIAMYTADQVLVPWLPSQTDILAEDWVILSTGVTPK